LLHHKSATSHEIPRKFELTGYSSSRLFKVIDLGVNRKRIYNFLLLINSNYMDVISYRFRDLTNKARK